MNEKPKTKRQHYVPVFLLKPFCDENGKIKVYDKNKKSCFVASPNDIFHSKYLYEKRLTAEYFSDPNGIENIFSKKESEWATLIKKLIDRCDRMHNKTGFVASAIEKRELESFAFNLFARNPYQMKSFSNSLEQEEPHEVLRLLSKYGIGDGSQMCKSFDLSCQFENDCLQDAFCKTLRSCFFYVGYSSKTNFYISDNPVICQFTKDDKMILILPISKKYCLVWLPSKIKQVSNQIVKIPDEVVTRINNLYMTSKFVKQIVI